MPDSDETGTTARWQTESKFYRRPPGLGWLLALLLIPLLLGAIGYGALERSRAEVSGPTVGMPPLTKSSLPSDSLTTPVVPAISVAPLSITRNENDLDLSGDLPDGAVKESLMDALRGSLGPAVNLVDNIDLKVGVSRPDLSGLGEVFKAGASIRDFTVNLDGDRLTLAGFAASEDDRAAVEAAAEAAFPGLRISNNIQLRGAAPGRPAAPSPGGSSSACDSLQADITRLLQTPVTFAADGHTLTPGSGQMLNQVADKLNACPDVAVTVMGYTDNTVDDAVNIALSDNRASVVADYLTSRGVAADRVTSRGLGPADPIASNDTVDGRAENRRVVIVIS